MEVQMPDLGWINGPAQLIFMQVFDCEMAKFERRQQILSLLSQMAAAAGESAAEQERAKVGQYL